MTDDTALAERDEEVAQAISGGMDLRRVKRQFALTQTELDLTLERLWPIDQQARLRLIKRDAARLDRLVATFYQRALGGCIQSGLLTVRIYERLHALLGMEAAQRVDLTITPPQHQTGHEKIRAAIYRLVEEQPPARRAAINKIEELGAEKALELLNAGNGDSDVTNGGSGPQ